MIPSDRLAAMFAALDDDGRRYAELILQHEYDRVQKMKRPALRAVGAGPRAAAPSPNSSAEAALLAGFRTLKAAHRENIVGMVKILSKASSHMRPALALVRSDRQGGAR